MTLKIERKKTHFIHKMKRGNAQKKRELPRPLSSEVAKKNSPQTYAEIAESMRNANDKIVILGLAKPKERV
jgi:hypothetical protein